MSIFENKRFTANALLDLIKEESDRIAQNNLCDDDLRSKMLNILNAAIAKSIASKDRYGTAASLFSEIHKRLSAVKLPGDFKKYASDEEFLLILDLPIDGDLESLLGDSDVDIKTVDEKDCIECEKEKKEDNENEEECKDCEDCDCEEDTMAQSVLADAVNKRLGKIAYMLGSQGKHDAARLVERTIQIMERRAKNNTLI